MSHKPLDRCRTAREIESYLSSRGAIKVHQVGSHAKWLAPGGASVTVPCHNGDIKRGTLSSIIKMVLIAGLGVALVACSYLAHLTATMPVAP